MRIPFGNWAEQLKFATPSAGSIPFTIPFYCCGVSAGFPSPADDFIEKSLDLNELLIKHPAATFFVRVTGASMIDAGIRDKDILIVDRSIEPTHGKIVVAAIKGSLTVKRLKIQNAIAYLIPENEQFSIIPVDPEEGVYIWGVVAHVIHTL